MKTVISKKQFDEERALYGISDTLVQQCRFDGPADGESAFKECKDISVDDCYFNLRYPFWHDKQVEIKNSEMTENCRAALWYDEGVEITQSKLHGIKVQSSQLQSEYPFFECSDVIIDDLNMKGKYSFQYVENMTIKNSNLDTKDAFWHSNNVTVVDSVVKGEYLGWYSENLKFIRCKIVGTQPLCYCRGLVLEDCIMEETDFSFERSEVDATIIGRIEGVKNPLCGRIVADEIGELLIEEQYVNGKDTVIICRDNKV